MKPFSIAAAAGLLIATSALGHAQSSGQRMPDSAPGQKMQDHGSVSGQPGASGFTPEHRMQEKGSRAGAPGTSGSAPDHPQPSTTGRDSMGDRDRGDAR
jgi:hypothetical protein